MWNQQSERLEQMQNEAEKSITKCLLKAWRSSICCFKGLGRAWFQNECLTFCNSVILLLITFIVLSGMDRAVHRSVVCENLGFVELGYEVGN